MKNLSRLLLLAGLAGFTSAHAETAAAPAAPAAEVAVSKPTVGNTAPEFKPTSWVQGDPVTAYEKGKVYVIECWATWCGPCVAMIPHLNDLHKKFADKGLVVIGTNVWDKDEATAAAFVKKKGEGMSYRVAYDNKETGAVTRDFLNAAGVRGIPHAFVVRDGKILWTGHPAGLSDTIVASMLDGTFDSAKAAAEQKAQDEKAAKFSTLQKDIATCIKEKKYDEALKKVDELEAMTKGASKLQLDFMRARIAGFTDIAAGVAKAKKVVDAAGDNKGALYQTAKGLLAAPFKGDKSAAALALECAKRLSALDGKQPAVKALLKQAETAAGVNEAADSKAASKPAVAEAK